MTQDASFGLIPIFHATPQSTMLFLVVKHHAGQGSGHWAFPKGHPEAHEDMRATVNRELAEETGITRFKYISDITFTESYSFKRGATTVTKTNTYFIGKVPTQAVTLQQEELDDYQWLSYREAYDRITYNESKQLLRAAHTYLLTTRKHALHTHKKDTLQ